MLAPAFRKLLEILLIKAENIPGINFAESVVDSMPIVVASGKRQKSAKVARESCAAGYCASKDMHYYGMKIHSLNFKRPNALPVPETFQITDAATHDLTAMKYVFRELHNRIIYADKAYIDRDLQAELTKNNVQICTPHKKRKGETEWETQFFHAGNTLWSSAVSSMRQPIESFFNWLDDRLGIQHASKVRSDIGLWVFIFVRLSAAILLLSDYAAAF